MTCDTHERFCGVHDVQQQGCVWHASQEHEKGGGQECAVLGRVAGTASAAGEGGGVQEGEGEGLRFIFVPWRGDHGSDDALYRNMQPQLQQLQLLRSERMQLVGKVAGV